MEYDYDVIVVGGRVAGSQLAARLGMDGMRVLLVERAELPSLPAVSSPIIYASAMKMLDEIGAREDEYAANTPRLHHMATVNRQFSAKMRIPVFAGRDYAYAVDRARFDYGVWLAAERQPNVTARMNYGVTDLLINDTGEVYGIVGKPKDGDREHITARAVIGADGRFSLVARKAGAQDVERHDDRPTSIYYAYWRGVTPLDEEGPSAAAYEGDGTFGYLVMDSADHQTVVCIEGRSEALEVSGGDVEALYLDRLSRNPVLSERLATAERVTSIRGMRNIGNLYRQPGGAGWALVGDAYHQKDPLDGQGIHDALFMGKTLALAMRRWWQGKLSWEGALAAYEQVVYTKTYPMYRSLQGRVQASFYSNIALPIPDWAVSKLGKWVSEDGGMSRLFGLMLTRQVPPDMIGLFAAPVAMNAIARGTLRDARKEVNRRLKAVVGQHD